FLNNQPLQLRRRNDTIQALSITKHCHHEESWIPLSAPNVWLINLLTPPLQAEVGVTLKPATFYVTSKFGEHRSNSISSRQTFRLQKESSAHSFLPFDTSQNVVSAARLFRAFLL